MSQIEVTESFLDEQIRQAQEEKNKNEKLYKKLGMSIGMAIVIILMWANWQGQRGQLGRFWWDKNVPKEPMLNNYKKEDFLWV